MPNNVKSTPERLKEDMDTVMELLDEFHHEELLRAAGDPGEPKPRVHNTLPDLRDRLNRLHKADVALVLESLSPDDRLLAWRQLRGRRGGEVLAELSEHLRADLIEQLSEEELRLAIGQIDTDALMSIADSLPPELLQERLQTIPDNDHRWLRKTMEYAHGSVGSLMHHEMIAVEQHHTVAEVLGHLRDLSELPDRTDRIFIITNEGALLGELALQTLLATLPELCISDVMTREMITFTPEEMADDAAQAFERYGLVSAAVINGEGKLLGRLTVDVIMHYLRTAHSKELLRFVGVRGGETLFFPLLQSAYNRWLWLGIGLLGALAASQVIALFEGTVAHLLALASLLPIIAAVGGTVANQCAALVNHNLCQGQEGGAAPLHLLRRELSTTLLSGALLALAGSLFVQLLYHSTPLSLVFAAAMVLNLLVAALLGIIVPLLLRRTGQAPAQGANVLLSVLADGLGFLILLSLAAHYLS